MGTSRSGRYLNTQGSRTSPSDYAVVHSNEGTFVGVGENKKPGGHIRLDSGGHGQDGMDLLDKYHIRYNIIKTYPNGVRVGNVPDHKRKNKQSGANQSWFPKDWSAKDIKKAGTHVASLKSNKHVPNGQTMFGMYHGVRVGVIKTNNVVATIFPDLIQPKQNRRK